MRPKGPRSTANRVVHALPPHTMPSDAAGACQHASAEEHGAARAIGARFRVAATKAVPWHKERHHVIAAEEEAQEAGGWSPSGRPALVGVLVLLALFGAKGGHSLLTLPPAERHFQPSASLSLC